MWTSYAEFHSSTVSYSYVLAIANEKSKLYGVQFHPEVDLTENGHQMLQNFLFDVAQCSGDYTLSNREEACVRYIKEAVGDHKVLVNRICLSPSPFHLE